MDLTGRRRETRAFPPPPSFTSPNLSEIWFCQDIPLDSSYKNIIYFASRSEQLNWFKSKAKVHEGGSLNGQPYVYDQSSQVRLGGSLRVSNHIGNLQNVNYLFFHNPNFDSSQTERQVWYFCFIDKVEYINPNTTEVFYTIDVFNTWLNSFTLMPSFVERETSDTDYLFENTQPEGYECGAYQCTLNEFLDLNGPGMQGGTITNINPETGWYSYFMVSEAEATGTSVSSKYWFPFRTDTFEPNDKNGLKQFFQTEGFKIIAGIIAPKWLVNQKGSKCEVRKLYNFNDFKLDFNYKPVNKKLFCYPYTFLEISNNLGQTQILRWEDFDTYKEPGVRECIFDLCSSFGMVPEITLMPHNYLGNGNVNTGNFNLQYNQFPQIPWSSDAYQTWSNANISQFNLQNNANRANAWIGGISGLTGGLLGAGGITQSAKASGSEMSNSAKISAASSAGSGFAGAASGLVSAITADYAFDAIWEDLSRTPDAVTNFTGASMYNYMHNRCGFPFKVKTIKREYARKIDSIFTRFGYRVGYLKEIDLVTIPRGYKYIQTRGANVIVERKDGQRAGFPTPALITIKNAFDAGLTIWKNPDSVGDYGQWLPGVYGKPTNFVEPSYEVKEND